MKSTKRFVVLRAVVGAGLALCGGAAEADDTMFEVFSLVSDGAVPAAHVDAHLVNPWGVAFNPTGYDWVADADSGYSTLYDGLGNPQSLVVAIPDEGGAPAQGNPTGIVYYGGAGFVVSHAGAEGPARFLFATENGTIAGWAPNVDQTNAFTVVDSTGDGASYKGLAVATGTANGDVIYAADFANLTVRVFDSGFNPILPGSFKDEKVPEGFGPFGIQTIGKTVFVTFALKEEGGDEEEVGPGLGYVDAFDTSGNLLRRVVSEGPLNAPWGMAMAPEDFGQFSGKLLVGNFGDGRINAFDAESGEHAGELRNPGGTPIEIVGLWGIAFGNGG